MQPIIFLSLMTNSNPAESNNTFLEDPDFTKHFTQEELDTMGVCVSSCTPIRTVALPVPPSVRDREKVLNEISARIARFERFDPETAALPLVILFPTLNSGYLRQHQVLYSYTYWTLA